MPSGRDVKLRQYPRCSVCKGSQPYLELLHPAAHKHSGGKAADCEGQGQHLHVERHAIITAHLQRAKTADALRQRCQAAAPRELQRLHGQASVSVLSASSGQTQVHSRDEKKQIVRMRGGNCMWTRMFIITVHLQCAKTADALRQRCQAAAEPKVQCLHEQTVLSVRSAHGRNQAVETKRSTYSI